jgi:hypothetical protein
LIVPLFASLAVLLAAAGEARPATRVVKRLDGSQITDEALTGRIEDLVKKARVAGLAIAIFNDASPCTPGPSG